ncbi:MAG: Holliday junction resolvase RuvX [Methylotenera sp.]|nr:Holliday junction resolvase RuvX [Methylotenera sp.]MDO9233821.1 Holliday junction resolvase RuvX [Methylotenera sp.]MDO9389504.1 Holliday junction resolvase RuvX [Methylotenera sp.]MDP1595674.1 Holliday junction resolvase RuvX [Methylotenera sp.]MDP1754829.1 Holliday junction resolvase RuvX [Methylotenera sp.]
MSTVTHMQLIDNENVYEKSAVESSTALAFDFGERRIGIAVGEHLLGSASPLTTIDNESNEIRFQMISTLIKEWQPKLLVVGLPLNVDGTEHAVTQLCKKFARRLNGRFNLPVMLIDERYSSVEASSLLNQTGIKGRAQKTMLDQVAAQTILQSYFDSL